MDNGGVGKKYEEKKMCERASNSLKVLVGCSNSRFTSNCSFSRDTSAMIIIIKLTRD